MIKPIGPRLFLAALMCLVVPATPLTAADSDGHWGIGVHGGLYKLVLSDHTDAWTPGWVLGADVKYGLTPKWSVGIEGAFMRTYLADLSGDKLANEDGAGSSFTKIPDGPMQRGVIAGLLGEYQFRKDATWSPFASVGAGMYFWKWTDKDGKTLMSDNAALDDPRAGLSIPTEDLAGNPYELKDQELYLMGGLGMAFAASDAISFELGLKFRYLTHVFTSFKDSKDIVGADPGELDLPRGIAEGTLGLTYHFGAGCPEPSASAAGSPANGPVPLDVQFQGSVIGGCPDYTYNWDFGDGTKSNEQSPHHTYETEGTYTAVLTVTDSKGKPATSNVVVTPSCAPVTATASGAPGSGQAPLVVAFQGGASGGCPPLTYVWEFGDGNTSADQNPKHEFAAEGAYTATLTVKDAKGASSEAKVPVKISSGMVPTQDKAMVLQGVNFQANKAVLLPEADEILKRVAQGLIAHPEVKVEIGGHTDSDGSASANLKLSQRRANAVRDYLVKQGVPAERMTAKGYGETQPISDNKTPEGKAMNRRVELKRM